MPSPNVILFDLDGTLIDSAPDLALAVNDTLQHLGKAPFPVETVRGWVGNGAKTLIERGLSGDMNVDPNLDSELAANALKYFLASYTENVCVDTVLYDGVETTLRQLKNDGYRLAIVTNKPEGFVGPIIEKLGIDDVFECIVGGDTLPQLKPHPEPIFYACQKMQVEVQNALMVGDSKNDLLAAKAAGIPSVGLTYGYHCGENLADFEPAGLYNEFSSLLSFLADRS